jgi:heat shock protein HslJ
VIGRSHVAGTILAAAVTVAGCIGFVADESTLEGTHWRAVMVLGMEPVPGREPTLQFGSGNVSGSGGCNAYVSTSLVIEGDRILMGGFGMELAQCGEARVMAVEDAYFLMLQNVDRFAFRDGQLVLQGTGGELSFQPVQGPDEPSG